jgi:hypothetical protein
MIPKKLAVIAVSAVVLALGTSGGVQASSLVVNGSFETTAAHFNFGGIGGPTKLATNSVVNNDLLPGWTMNAGAIVTTGGLNSLNSPGTATSNQNSTIAVYSGFPSTSPDGGNFMEADGNPTFSSSFQQTLTGLTIGQTYAVSFYQAAGQQQGFTGATTGEWQVSFGGSTLLSHLMNNTPGGNGTTGSFYNWEAQTLTFTADGTSDVLKFLAIGTTVPDNPNGPPIVFLDGVSASAVPLPTAVSLGFVGMLCIAAFRTRRGAKPATESTSASN